MDEWRGLKLNVLRLRIQRLVVLMDLSEPGTVPDPGMLASLIDLVRVGDIMCACLGCGYGYGYEYLSSLSLVILVCYAHSVHNNSIE